MQSTADLLKLAANLKHLSSVSSGMKWNAKDDDTANIVTYEGRFLFSFLVVSYLMFTIAISSSSTGEVFPLENVQKGKAKQEKKVTNERRHRQSCSQLAQE